MAVFAVVNITDMEFVQKNLDLHFKDHYHPLGERGWLVASQGQTVRQVATKVGVGDAGAGESFTSGLVIPVTNYYGRQHNDVWEWLKVNHL